MSFLYLADFRKPFGVHRKSAPKISRFRAGALHLTEAALFQTIAIPFDAYAALPSPAHRWLMACLARYSDRAGICWPSVRQLAADGRMSPATVSRRLADLDRLGCFTRVRKPGGRYRYTLAAPYRLHWSGPERSVSAPERGISRAATQEAKPQKHFEKERFADSGLPDYRSQWLARLRWWRESRFWLPAWGPKPTEPGCFAPPALVRTIVQPSG